MNVHAIIPPEGLVLHLGSVLDHCASVDFWNWSLAQERRSPQQMKALFKTRPTGIRRLSWISLIPTTSEELSLPVLTDAIGRYLWHYVPSLMRAHPQIHWLNQENEQLAHELEREIVKQAQAGSVPMSDEDVRGVIESDIPE